MIAYKEWQQTTKALAWITYLDALDGTDFTVCEFGERTLDVNPRLKLLIISLLCRNHTKARLKAATKI